VPNGDPEKCDEKVSKPKFSSKYIIKWGQQLFGVAAET
jgi:hypothetical protein